MDIGIPREIKPHEGRVSLLPHHVEELIREGHCVRVEKKAGMLSGANDKSYEDRGARIVDSPLKIFEKSTLILKVKEPLDQELKLLSAEHILFTNIHSAAKINLTENLLKIGLTAISAEKTHQFGSPNCRLAGELGALEGVHLCLTPFGGSGRHFTSHFGSPAIKAVILGLGTVGRSALSTLMKLGCSVSGIDISASSREQCEREWPKQNFRSFDIDSLPNLLIDADLLINCVLWPKYRNDHLIDRNMLEKMKSTAVIVDISCDEHGAIETTRATNWQKPVYVEEGIRHFCVDNIPGAVPISASAGYGDAILPFIKLIGKIGVLEACRQDPWLAKGLTCVDGELILEEAGIVQKRAFTPIKNYLNA